MSDPYGAPQPPAQQSSPDDNTWAIAAHIGALVAAWFAFGFLAPLIVMLVKSDSPYVRRHAVESLNFQISILIYGVVGAIVAFVVALVTFGIGLLVIVPVAIAVLVLIILATMAASRGEDYRYPLTIRFIS
jgi:uncharacterized Tic20 family protein